MLSFCLGSFSSKKPTRATGCLPACRKKLSQGNGLASVFRITTSVPLSACRVLTSGKGGPCLARCVKPRASPGAPAFTKSASETAWGLHGSGILVGGLHSLAGTGDAAGADVCPLPPPWLPSSFLGDLSGSGARCSAGVSDRWTVALTWLDQSALPPENIAFDIPSASCSSGSFV